jgi:hypothetical protein
LKSDAAAEKPEIDFREIWVADFRLLQQYRPKRKSELRMEGVRELGARPLEGRTLLKAFLRLKTANTIGLTIPLSLS